MFDFSSYVNPTPLAHADASRDVFPMGGTSQEEDMPSLELENERSGWSKIFSDVQLNSKLSKIQRGQLKELLYEYSNFFSNIPGCTDLAEHDIEL
ncbi:retrovirus-related Pol polyprotein from transposon 412 [Trichonephila clavipes]|nr:retrovirus-related Pol polyprotein from transposon 412 [Trichonephila clavipes]